MRKTTLGMILASCLTASLPALANDTSFPEINVDEIETDTKVGSHIEFSGGQAVELFKVLPKVSSAGGPEIESKRHGLLVTSPGYQVYIACSKLDENKPVSCGIYFNERNDDMEGFPFKAENACPVE